MIPSSENLKDIMGGKTDEELYDILFSHSQDYTQAAVEAARVEFSHRQLDAPTLSSIEEIVEKVRENEEAPLSWSLRILAFFVSSAFVFIPVILAHRHFVEKGEKRKASDWAKWATYGFVFYCVLGLLIRVLSS